MAPCPCGISCEVVDNYMCSEQVNVSSTEDVKTPNRFAADGAEVFSRVNFVRYLQLPT